MDTQRSEADKVIAEQIRKISEGMEQLLKGGLAMRAIVVLLADSTGVGMREIRAVLNGLKDLKANYTNPPKPGDK